MAGDMHLIKGTKYTLFEYMMFWIQRFSGAYYNFFNEITDKKRSADIHYVWNSQTFYYEYPN